MKFPSQLMSDSDILKAPLIKEIEKNLDSLTFLSVKENNKRVYRNPSSGKNAVIISLELSGGMDVIFWVSQTGNVVRVELNHDVVESATANEDAAQITERELASEIKKKIMAEQKAEFKVKIDKKKIGQLIDDLQNEGDEDEDLQNSRMKGLKEDLTKGSGKFIILNASGEFYGRNGYTKVQSEIVAFDALEDAKNAVAQDANGNPANGEKVVRI